MDIEELEETIRESSEVLERLAIRGSSECGVGVSAVHSNWLDRLKVLWWSGYREGRRTQQKSTKRTDREPEEKDYGSLVSNLGCQRA
ncbi:hypothetical protein NPIL_697961 [Nephila pilipes]|uniref:Uncharacterized protein n=1 Tax=Nephila pilipes TaxID=299642 RepID=A0A8X6QWB5_NEPPI|nr:hypothetical protein NPIL_697961 [Nephila pilipes]